jgi:hypothetical protein
MSAARMMVGDVEMNGPMMNVQMNYAKFGIEKRVSGAILAHVKVAVMNASNVFYSVACLVKDVALTLIGAVAAIFGEGGRNFLKIQLAHTLEDLGAIPASILGIILPKTAHDMAEGLQEAIAKGFFA